MIEWTHSTPIYLHRNPVDFRKAINGLSVIVSDIMELDVYQSALFVFCNRRRDQIKVLYWDYTGFALWQKRLEKDKFKWPKKNSLDTVSITHEQWSWLLRGVDFEKIQPHQTLKYSHVA
ncbi:IS66 family insertion sequence element accessory protein TnpB [Marinibactrum halimedae]|uniref:Transposase n=1 Tax=Marinibactrum halimedae TaxID=1444977 RepID=A0AA37T3A0_9GAMM|nr:IS66 family insertion sequence element accessory protein TnpB [Marinibactrum halimedae]MCD9461029.1 IS66 family insertion sequence element accessory protein TnpB [Marinibactrum halimedae]GLS24407.1 transposase [Marinibactrum halimedae]